ncbi:hypothetical protein ACFPOA_09760 [Lysobacter niabensis]|uniref:hypothetical protein n=1 Tax=Agrilutibacter niabensis TaxID=380628 RepID=UPI003606F792
MNVSTSPLASEVIERYGGSRWNRFNTVTSRLRTGGVLWPLKQQAGVLDDVFVRVHLREPRASHFPFTAPHLRTSYQPHRGAIEDGDGNVVSELPQPRQSFQGHGLDTPWTELQLAYFAGYAMWTYLNTPFLFALDGVETRELTPWHENGEAWRRLQVTLPAGIPSHGTFQTFYFDADLLLKRHDYDTEVLGGTHAAHYTSDHVEVSGILVPTRRWVLARNPDGSTQSEPTIVSIVLSDIVFQGA